MTYTYNINALELWRPTERDYVPAFQVECVRTSPAGKANREVLATYTNRAAAELVVSALRAAQTDLT